MADQHDLAEQLLGLAAEDEAALRAMVDVPAVTDAIVAFHAQQTVEKALKALLAARGVDFPFTHDLRVVIDLCDSAGIAVPPGLADAPRLTPHAVAQRYGTADPGDVSPGPRRPPGRRTRSRGRAPAGRAEPSARLTTPTGRGRDPCRGRAGLPEPLHGGRA